MSPDCPYCWLKDGANIDHVCDVVNVKKNLDTQWEITAETQRSVERLLAKVKAERERCAIIVEEKCGSCIGEDTGEGCQIAKAVRNKPEKE